MLLLFFNNTAYALLSIRANIPLSSLSRVGVLAGNPMPVMSFLRSEGGSLTAAVGTGSRGGVPDVHMMFSSAVIGGFDPIGNMHHIYDALNLDDDTVSSTSKFYDIHDIYDSRYKLSDNYCN